MRIGFDAKRAFLNRTGLGNYSRGVIDSVLRQESTTKVHLYTPDPDRSIISDATLSDSKTIVKKPPVHLRGPLSSVWRSKFVCDQIRNDEIDLYHGLSNELPKGIESTGVASVVTIHDLIFLHYPEYYKSIDRKIYETKVKHACEVATRVIATSEQTADDIVRSLGTEREKISVVYQGCNPVFYDQISSSEIKARSKGLGLPEHFILSVGTIESRKNVKVLVKALKILGSSNLKLVIVGRKTPYTDEVIALARKLGVVDRLVILDSVSTADLPLVYQCAEVFVLPSLMEGFGIPVLEAMVSKTPVIVSEKSCLAEVCGDAGIHIDPTNEEQIANAISMVLNDENKRPVMVANGIIRAERFSQERISEDLMEVYRLAMAQF